MVATAPAVVERWELALPRAKCSACHRGFTCYPAGVYPRRQYHLDVVADGAAAVALGGEPVAAVAGVVGASQTSVRRWCRWIAALASVAELVAAAAQIDPSGATAATPQPSGTRGCAAGVLVAFEVLGAALVRAGVTVVERTGLGRVLGWQHRHHGDVYGLVAGVTRLSPAMAPGGRPRRS